MNGLKPSSMKIVLLSGQSFTSNDWELKRTVSGVFYISKALGVAIPIHSIAYIEGYENNKTDPFDSN